MCLKSIKPISIKPKYQMLNLHRHRVADRPIKVLTGRTQLIVDVASEVGSGSRSVRSLTRLYGNLLVVPMTKIIDSAVLRLTHDAMNGVGGVHREKSRHSCQECYCLIRKGISPIRLTQNRVLTVYLNRGQGDGCQQDEQSAG